MPDPTDIVGAASDAEPRPDLVEVGARADHRTNRLCLGPIETCQFAEDHRTAARAVLAAASAAGALRPPKSETAPDEMPYAREIVAAWLTQLGYTPDEIAIADADNPDPERCVLVLASGRTCLDEDGQHRHPIHADIDEAGHVVMFALEQLTTAGALMPDARVRREEWAVTYLSRSPARLCLGGQNPMTEQHSPDLDAQPTPELVDQVAVRLADHRAPGHGERWEDFGDILQESLRHDARDILAVVQPVLSAAEERGRQQGRAEAIADLRQFAEVAHHDVTLARAADHLEVQTKPAEVAGG